MAPGGRCPAPLPGLVGGCQAIISVQGPGLGGGEGTAWTPHCGPMRRRQRRSQPVLSRDFSRVLATGLSGGCQPFPGPTVLLLRRASSCPGLGPEAARCQPLPVPRGRRLGGGRRGVLPRVSPAPAQPSDSGQDGRGVAEGSWPARTADKDALVGPSILGAAGQFLLKPGFPGAAGGNACGGRSRACTWLATPARRSRSRRRPFDPQFSARNWAPCESVPVQPRRHRASCLTGGC